VARAVNSLCAPAKSPLSTRVTAISKCPLERESEPLGESGTPTFARCAQVSCADLKLQAKSVGQGGSIASAPSIR
jgi:hypothetical protein